MTVIDRVRWRWIALRFIPWLAALNLAWETAHLPLYTLWRDASFAYLAFSVAHCTAGDVLIGTSALLVGLVLVPERRPGLALVCIAAIAVAYTVFSEWLNTSVLESWAYSELMPTLQVRSLRLGLSPVFQALLVPALAAFLAGILTSIKTRPAGGRRRMNAAC